MLIFCVTGRQGVSESHSCSPRLAILIGTPAEMHLFTSNGTLCPHCTADFRFSTFWNAFLFTTVVKSGYFGYRSLPVSLSQSVYSPLTALIHIQGVSGHKTTYRDSVASKILQPPTWEHIYNYPLPPILKFIMNINWIARRASTLLHLSCWCKAIRRLDKRMSVHVFRRSY